MHAHSALGPVRTLGAARCCPPLMASRPLAHLPATAPIVIQDGRLPLHVGLENKAPVEVVQAVLDAYPDAIKEKTDVRLPAIS